MEGHYKVREIVWAKVQPHPWWPGKIVKILEQNKKTVYKVSFFADPTYTFLHDSQLTPYLALDHTVHKEDLAHPQVQRAVAMAQTYFVRHFGRKQEELMELQGSAMTDFSQEEKREENVTQNIVIPEERVEEARGEAMQVESSPQEECVSDEITVDNVLEMIERNRKKQKNGGYSYENRKGEMQLQAELKRTLLAKYNLLDLATEKQQRQPEGPLKRSLAQIAPQRTASRQLKKICKQKSKTKHLLHGQIQILRSKCLRKITSLLKNTQESAEISKIHAVKIMKRIVALAEGNRMKLQSLFCTVVRALSSGSPQLRSEEKLAEFSNYLQQLESEKMEDEGSKITQIQIIN